MGEWGGCPRKQGAPFATDCLINWLKRRGSWSADYHVIYQLTSCYLLVSCDKLLLPTQVSDQCCPSQAREEGKWPRTKWWGLLWSTHQLPQPPIFTTLDSAHPPNTPLQWWTQIHCERWTTLIWDTKYWSKLISSLSPTEVFWGGMSFENCLIP